MSEKNLEEGPRLGSQSAAACPACVCYQFVTATHGLFPNTCLRNHNWRRRRRGRGREKERESFRAETEEARSQREGEGDLRLRKYARRVAPLSSSRRPRGWTIATRFFFPSSILRPRTGASRAPIAREPRTHKSRKHKQRERERRETTPLCRRFSRCVARAIFFAGTRRDLADLVWRSARGSLVRSATVEHVRPRSAGKCVRKERETQGRNQAEAEEEVSRYIGERERERERDGGGRVGERAIEPAGRRGRGGRGGGGGGGGG